MRRTESHMEWDGVTTRAVRRESSRGEDGDRERTRGRQGKTFVVWCETMMFWSKSENWRHVRITIG